MCNVLLESLEFWFWDGINVPRWDLCPSQKNNRALISMVWWELFHSFWVKKSLLSLDIWQGQVSQVLWDEYCLLRQATNLLWSGQVTCLWLGYWIRDTLLSKGASSRVNWNADPSTLIRYLGYGGTSKGPQDDQNMRETNQMKIQTLSGHLLIVTPNGTILPTLGPEESRDPSRVSNFGVLFWLGWYLMFHLGQVHEVTRGSLCLRGPKLTGPSQTGATGEGWLARVSFRVWWHLSI